MDITKSSDTNKKIAVFGIFDSVPAAEIGMNSLKSAGFPSESISALLPNGQGNIGHEKGTKAPEGATTGGTTGALIGGTLGWLVGVGTLAFPGVGALIAAGPIMALLAGASVGTAVGALGGALVGYGIPEYTATRYESRVKEGGVLVSIHCNTSEERDLAKRLLTELGASDISSTTEKSVDGAIDSDTSNLTPSSSRIAV